MQVSAKFQIITVPVLTDKVVLMKWHTLSSKLSKHDSVDRKHDVTTKRVSHSQVMPGNHSSYGDSDRGGCVFSERARQQQLSEHDDGREPKPKLRFDMDAERRYSVTAKPLYQPHLDAQPASEGIIVASRRRHVDKLVSSLNEGGGCCCSSSVACIVDIFGL
jgi:hypothetical protein